MSLRLPIAFAGLLLIGVLACPKPHRVPPVDPGVLFSGVLEKQGGSGPASSERMRRLIARNYTVSVSGEDVVAGRRAWVLAIRPRIRNRPWRQLWIDQKTFETLALRDWTGTNKSKRVVGGVSDPDNAKRVVGGVSDPDRPRPELVEGRRSGSDTPPTLPRYVPPGFELVEARILAAQGWSQIVYSDGLCAISVFQRFPAGLSREHRRRVFVYEWGRGLLLFTFRAGREAVVVADLPADELEKIAGSIP